MSLYLTLAIAVPTILSLFYGREIFSLLHWYLSAPQLQPAVALSTNHHSTQNQLVSRLLQQLRSGSSPERERAERLLLNHPTADITPALLSMLNDGPWSESGAAAARLLLSKGDDKVIEPLNEFFARQDGGFASFLGEIEETKAAVQQTGKVISLFGRRRKARQ